VTIGTSLLGGKVESVKMTGNASRGGGDSKEDDDDDNDSSIILVVCDLFHRPLAAACHDEAHTSQTKSSVPFLFQTV
jgi:hypothetical protein